MLKMIARTTMIEEPLYVRHKMQESLTVSPETGIGTPYRAQARARLAELFRRCYDSPTETKTLIEGSIAEPTKALMDSEIERLKSEMRWS